MRRLSGGQQGNALIEFAIVVMVLAVLGVGMFDFGRYGLLYTRAYNAARAGTQYGIQSQGTAVDFNGMVDAARTDASDDNDELNVVARRYCMCPETSTETACTGTCGDGKFVPIFVEVTVRDTLDFLFTYPGVADTLQIATRSEMRVR
ncbi:MAG: TadE/TadG family type IV pilus assembly protein [Alphaproteobacteria bacterium]|nr:TadE/TadG family type IV pilus assembly protein [Alphaproteobacteria bacterium]